MENANLRDRLYEPEFHDQQSIEEIGQKDAKIQSQQYFVENIQMENGELKKQISKILFWILATQYRFGNYFLECFFVHQN